MRGFLIILALIGLIAGGGYGVRTYAPQYLPDEWTTDAVLRERMRDELRTDARADAFFTKFEALFPADYNELLNSLVSPNKVCDTAEHMWTSALQAEDDFVARFVSLSVRMRTGGQP